MSARKTVVAGAGGLLSILTSNRDGKTVPTMEDDLLLVVDSGRPVSQSQRSILLSAHLRQQRHVRVFLVGNLVEQGAEIFMHRTFGGSVKLIL